MTAFGQHINRNTSRISPEGLLLIIIIQRFESMLAPPNHTYPLLQPPFLLHKLQCGRRCVRGLVAG